MRIMFAVHTYYPAHNGVQAVTQYIAEGLAKKHEVMVLAEKKNIYCESEVHNNVAIKRIDVWQKNNRFFGEREKYLSIIEEFAPDALICVCTQSWPFDWIVSELEHLKCKKILYTHGYTAYLEKYPIVSDLIRGKLRAFKYHLYWKKYYEKAYKYIEKFDKVTYLSENNSANMYAKKHSLNNGMILGNAVEDSFFENCILENEDHFEKKRKIQYIYIANYDDNKNQKEVLETFYRAKLENANMVFVGGKNNEYYDELCELNRQKAAINSATDVQIIYGQSREKIRELLSESDVFVCGSKHEEFPVMLCEAAAKGLAIISSNVGHAKEMPGCIVVNNMNEMIEQMKVVAENVMLRKSNGMKLRHYAQQNCRIKDKISEFESMLEELVRNGEK